MAFVSINDIFTRNAFPIMKIHHRKQILCTTINEMGTGPLVVFDILRISGSEYKTEGVREFEKCLNGEVVKIWFCAFLALYP